MTLDIQWCRAHPDQLRAGVAQKKFDGDIDAFLALDFEWRQQLSQVEVLRAEQNKASEALSRLEKSSESFCSEVERLRALSRRLKAQEEALHQLEARWEEAFLAIPNLPHPSAPSGKMARDNREIPQPYRDLRKAEGDGPYKPQAVSPQALPHYEIPGFGRAIDFARGAKVSGAGFPFYVGDMARLVRALIAFFLEEARSRGYIELLPPLFVNAPSARATGQLPDKEGQMYQASEDGLYAVPTAEVPVTNFFRDEVFEAKELPIYRCAYTPCFRREAGSWGKEVRGLNRLHQFDKVELVKWVEPERGLEELESLRADAEMLLQKLELPYRVLEICTGDMGFPHAKQYDLEVWAGGQKRWLEVSSCSYFTDFQARRARIRFRDGKTGQTAFVHTLNGSGLAVPRVLAALLENFLQEDRKSVAIPQVLRPWFPEEYLHF
ncbi:MAG: serine--tRNA ligase [Puniceicoccales bacterium]|jgi:seryl-tRNA synthetase|nr:serine--tRNA ligase [Puniceicoccales bacterium]